MNLGESIIFHISTFLKCGLTPWFSRGVNRTLVVPEKNLHGFLNEEYTSRKASINFPIPHIPGSGITPQFPRVLSKEFKRALAFPERSLGGF